jgi:hypothetical protein
MKKETKKVSEKIHLKSEKIKKKNDKKKVVQEEAKKESEKTYDQKEEDKKVKMKQVKKELEKIAEHQVKEKDKRREINRQLKDLYSNVQFSKQFKAFSENGRRVSHLLIANRRLSHITSNTQTMIISKSNN